MNEKTMEAGPTALADLAEREQVAALADLGAGDLVASDLVHQASTSVSDVRRLSRAALARAQALANDDVSNPIGISRQLEELPAQLQRDTEALLQQAESALDVVKAAHTASILTFRHSTEDPFLLAEVGNFTHDLKQADAVRTLVGLAGNVRYSALMAGPLGASLAARFSLDPAVLSKTALEALKAGGSEEQQRRGKALDSLPAAHRVVGLTRGNRDAALQEIRQTPKPRVRA